VVAFTEDAAQILIAFVTIQRSGQERNAMFLSVLTVKMESALHQDFAIVQWDGQEQVATESPALKEQEHTDVIQTMENVSMQIIANANQDTLEQIVQSLSAILLAKMEDFAKTQDKLVIALQPMEDGEETLAKFQSALTQKVFLCANTDQHVSDQKFAIAL